MSAQLLALLKFSLLGLLYLFLFRVVRAVWAELAPPTAGSSPAAAAPGRRSRRKVPPSQPEAPVGVGVGAATVARSAGPTATTRSRPPRLARAGKRHEPHLVVVEPAGTAGTSFALTDEMTIGRAGGCGITVDDTFVSQLHARLWRDGESFYVEDLGSTNGTLRNGAAVGGPQQLERGDLLQVGDTIMEMR